MISIVVIVVFSVCNRLNSVELIITKGREKCKTLCSFFAESAFSPTKCLFLCEGLLLTGLPLFDLHSKNRPMHSGPSVQCIH